VALLATDWETTEAASGHPHKGTIATTRMGTGSSVDSGLVYLSRQSQSVHAKGARTIIDSLI
jgi:hypothetical protein